MTKKEFLKLFKVEDIYKNNKVPFGLSGMDYLTGTDNAYYFIFDNSEKYKVIIESLDFSETIQKIELNFIIQNDTLLLDVKEQNTNELFKFLDFDNKLKGSLEFLAGYLNNILVPSHHLMGGIYNF